MFWQSFFSAPNIEGLSHLEPIFFKPLVLGVKTLRGLVCVVAAAELLEAITIHHDGRRRPTTSRRGLRNSIDHATGSWAGYKRPRLFLFRSLLDHYLPPGVGSLWWTTTMGLG